MATSGYPSTSEITLVLLGTLGCGKTASADTILGQVAPASPSSSFGSSSRVCHRRQGVSEGRKVTVVEAPRWYWNGQQVEESVRKESQRALQLAAPGPHAFLLLIPVCQFTEVEGRVPAEMKEVFGPEVLKHTLVLLTCGDYLAGQTEEMYMQGEDPGLREVIGRCGGRYHIINNRQRHERQQVRTLLDKVEDMVAMNGGPYVPTSPQRQGKVQAPAARTPPLITIESPRVVEEKVATARQPVGYKEPPVTAGQRGADAAARPGFPTGEGLPSSGASAARRSPPRHGNGADGMYGSVVDGPVPDQTNAAERATVPQMSRFKPSERNIQTSYQEVNSIREQSSYQSAPTVSSPQSPSSGSSSSLRASSSSSSRLLSSSSSSQSQLPSSSSQSQLPSSAPSSSSQLPFSSSSSSSKLPSSSSSQLPSSSSSSKLPSSSSSQLPSSSSSSKLPSPSSSLPSSSPSSSYSMSSSPELRLVLLGNSGVGKSMAGNSILGKEEFETRPNSLVAVTQRCEKRRALVAGRKVAVIDTPDWFHTECSPDVVRGQISSCVALSSPGPHAFLLCVPLDRPASSELQALGVLEAVFGADAVSAHTLLLFTQVDQLRASGKVGGHADVESYIGAERADLVKLVERCGDRFHVLELGADGARSVDQLLGKVEQTVREAGGGCYSCPAFQEAEERVRQRQREIASQRMGEQRGGPRSGRPSMQTLSEAEEDRGHMDEARDEAEWLVGGMQLESLPPITAATLSPSLMGSMREMVQSTAKWLPKLLGDGLVMTGDGVKKVAQSPVWGKMGTGAKDVQRMVAGSAVWEKVRAGAGALTKPAADSGVAPREKVPGGADPVPGPGTASAVRSRARMVADSPVWGKVGSGAKSGAKLMSDGSIWVGSGAKSLAQSPVWGRVGSGAKSGAKLMADGSVRVGAGLGEGMKKVAQSPVWGKMGAGAKAGAIRVAESPVWEKLLTEAKKVPVVVAGGAILGLLLGVVLGGVLGGAIGAATGSVVTEVGRRKFSKDGNSVVELQSGGMSNLMMEGEQSLIQSGQQRFKAE